MHPALDETMGEPSILWARFLNRPFERFSIG